MATKQAKTIVGAAKSVATRGRAASVRTPKAQATVQRGRMTQQAILQRKAAFALAMADALRDILRCEQSVR